MTDSIEKIAVDRLDFVLAPLCWDFAERHASEIDAHWDRLTTENPSQFNGPVLLLQRGELVRDNEGRFVFSGAFFETDYKSFVAWRDLGFSDGGMRNCFAMAALRSEDGAFLLGEMNSHTTLPGRIQFPAGTPDRNDVRENIVDLEASVYREMLEETGLGRDDVAAAPGWTLILDGRRIACMKPMQARGLAREIAARVAANLSQQPEPELACLHIVRTLEGVDTRRIPSFMLAYLRAALGATN